MDRCRCEVRVWGEGGVRWGEGVGMEKVRWGEECGVRVR